MYKETIKFKYKGKTYTFKTEYNRMVSQFLQVWYFEPLRPIYIGSVVAAKTIAKNIKKYNKGELKLPDIVFQ